MADKANAYLENLFYLVLSIGETTTNGERHFAIVSPVLQFLDVSDARNMLFVNKEVSEIVKIYHDSHKFPVQIFSFTQHPLLGEKIQIRLKGNDLRIVRFDPARIGWNKEKLELWFDRNKYSAHWGRTKFTFENTTEYNIYRNAYELFIPKIKARWAKKNAELRAIADEKQRAAEEREARRLERQREHEAEEQAKIEAEQKRIQREKLRIGPVGYKPPVAPWAKNK